MQPYTLTELITDGWLLDNMTCESNISSSVVVTDSQSINFIPAESEQIVCTMTNLKLPDPCNATPNNGVTVFGSGDATAM